MTELLKALQDASYWMRGFNYRSYGTMLEKYTATFEPVFSDKLCDDVDLVVTANALLDEVEGHVSSLRRWNRNQCKTDMKLLATAFLSPMLLKAENPRCGEFAKVLCDEWKRRWPKDAYQVTDVQDIQSGFRNAIFGISIDTFKGKSRAVK